MFLIKKFYLISFLIFFIAFANLSYGQQKLIDVFVGNTKIAINLPSDFINVDSNSSPMIWKIAEIMTTSEKELLAVIVEKDTAISYQKNNPLKKYLLVQVSKQIKDTIYSDKEFSEFKNQFRQNQNDLYVMNKDKMDNFIKQKSKDIDKLSTTKILEQDTIPLGIFHETNNSMSTLMILQQVLDLDGKKDLYLTAVAPTFLLIKGKMIYLYVCNEYHSEVDSEWVKSMSKKWITSVIESNQEKKDSELKLSLKNNEQKAEINKIYLKNGKVLIYDKTWRDGNTVFVVVKGKKFAVGYNKDEIDLEKSFNSEK
jgi:hypothetical protein